VGGASPESIITTIPQEAALVELQCGNGCQAAADDALQGAALPLDLQLRGGEGLAGRSHSRVPLRRL
jgi:hypothetical protein